MINRPHNLISDQNDLIKIKKISKEVIFDKTEESSF